MVEKVGKLNGNYYKRTIKTKHGLLLFWREAGHGISSNAKGRVRSEDHLPLSSGETITNGQDNGTLTWWYSIFRDKLDHSSVL